MGFDVKSVAETNVISMDFKISPNSVNMVTLKGIW